MPLTFVIIAILAVLAVLFVGLIGMARGDHPAHAQRWMRYRVLIQGSVILLIILSACLVQAD